MQKLNLIILSILLLCACNSGSTANKETPAQHPLITDSVKTAETVKETNLPPLKNEEVNLTENDFGEIIELKGTTHPVKNFFDVCIGLKAKDTLLIITKYGKGCIMAFSLPSFKLVKSIANEGKGPDEYFEPSLVNVEKDSSLCYIYNRGAGELNILDKNLKVNPNHIKLKTTSPFSSKQIYGLSPIHFLYVEAIDKGKAVFEHIITGDSSSTKQIYNLAFSDKHKNWAAYIGDFGANGSKKRFVYAYKYFKRLLFHDLENNTTKVVNFKAAPAIPGNAKDMLAPTNVTHYWGMSAQKDYVYVLYSGRTPIQVTKENNKTSGYIYVEQFDWNGNPIRKFKLDHWGYFCVNDAENTIILASTTEMDPFFTYEIPKL